MGGRAIPVVAATSVRTGRGREECGGARPRPARVVLLLVAAFPWLARPVTLAALESSCQSPAVHEITSRRPGVGVCHLEGHAPRSPPPRFAPARWYFAGTPATRRAVGPDSLTRYERLSVASTAVTGRRHQQESPATRCGTRASARSLPRGSVRPSSLPRVISRPNSAWLQSRGRFLP